MKVIEPIWSEKPETANRLRGRIETVLDWATVRGYRHGENPARWRGHLDMLLPSRSRCARRNITAPCPMPNCRHSWSNCASRMVSRRALEFTILTAARTGETIGAEEIDRREESGHTEPV